MDTTISWMIGGGFRVDEPDHRKLAHIRALREARAQEPRPAGRLAAAVSAALGGLLGRRARAATTSSGVSLDTVCCLA
ncbi:MAG TPA: hypothetical protein VFT20_03415 [Candidatus Limnocylindrales bacterium]|nr:hypothetical protein [Candidatus Limnocylindrales bacterium]